MTIDAIGGILPNNAAPLLGLAAIKAGIARIGDVDESGGRDFRGDNR
jgi:hypothetical protein